MHAHIDDDDIVVAGPDDTELLVPSCPNICCTGAFIQEAMMGVVMSAEVSILIISNNIMANIHVQVRQLIFTSEKVQSRRQFPSTLEFNVPLVLTHLLGKRFESLPVNKIFHKKSISGATDGKKSQLERLVFSENFVKEESEVGRKHE